MDLRGDYGYIFSKQNKYKRLKPSLLTSSEMQVKAGAEVTYFKNGEIGTELRKPLITWSILL